MASGKVSFCQGHLSGNLSFWEGHLARSVRPERACVSWRNVKRTVRRSDLGLVLLGAVLAGCLGAPRSQAPPPATPALADHHVHLLSPGLLRDWAAAGATFSRAAPVYTSAEGLFESSLDQAVLVPMAHLYSSGWLRERLELTEDQERERVRRENDHVAAEAKRYPRRAVAFCSVGVLRPYTWDEIRRCRESLGSPGIKLHLASSGVDLRNEEHLEEIAKIAGWAETEEVALLVHFDPQARGLDVEDVERFIARVLAPHERLEVMIPHLGGSGGYGPWTRSVFRTFVNWLDEEARKGRPRPGVTFDVSAVILEEESEGVPPTTPEEAASLAEDLRSLGLARVMFGSDYPVFDPQRYLSLLQTTLRLSTDELETLRRNRLPVLARLRRQPS